MTVKIHPLHDRVTCYKITHAAEQVAQRDLYQQQCNLYQSTMTDLCYGSPTAKLAYQHVQVCTMRPDRTKAYLFNLLVTPTAHREIFIT